MQIRVKDDSVEITGYVNAIERVSKPLMSRAGQFIERICKGAFNKALKRNKDVHILLNHDWNRDLGSTKKGNLELTEDNIGLRVRAILTDKEVIDKARNGKLVGWSFGFSDIDVENSVERGMPLRAVKDLDLYEVSILDNSKTPAYDGTLVSTRAETNEIHYRGEDFIDDVNILQDEENTLKNESDEIISKEDAEKTTEKEIETLEQEKRSEQQENVVKNTECQEIDYSKYENMIKEMKGDF